jgi:hypothetical protein
MRDIMRSPVPLLARAVGKGRTGQQQLVGIVQVWRVLSRENGDFNKKSKFLNVHQRKNLRCVLSDPRQPLPFSSDSCAHLADDLFCVTTPPPLAGLCSVTYHALQSCPKITI